MNSKEFQSAVLIKLDSAMGEMREVKRIAKAVEMRVENIAPQSHLHPIPRPPQKEVGRDLNIASWFRLKTKEENAMLPENAARKYIEFPGHLSDEQLNEDMKRCMYNIMCERLKPGWETMNWNMIYNSDKMLGEQIVKEAALRPEMAVIAQSSGYWAIRKIAEQRQKSTKRSAEQRNARVRVKKENKGSFGSRYRGNKERFDENASGSHNPDEINEGITAEDQDIKNQEKEGNDGDEMHFAPPAVSMAEKAVEIVEDLDTQADTGSEENVPDEPVTDEISSSSSAEKMKSAGLEDSGTVSKESQTPANKVALLLKTLTPEQISAIISQSEASTTSKGTARQISEGIKKRKTKKNEGQGSGGKTQRTARRASKSKGQEASHPAGTRTRKRSARR